MKRNLFSKIIALTLALVVATLFFACKRNKEPAPEKIYTVAIPDGAPLLSLAKMQSDDPVINRIDLNYQILSSDQLVAALSNQEPDFAIAPINVCAMMYNNGSGYRFAGVSIWGILHIVSSESEPNIDSLKGETIIAFAKANTPGITLRAILDQYEIKYVEDQGSDYIPASDEVHIIYLKDAVLVKDALVAGKINDLEIKFALLAEPVVTQIATATQNKYSAKINLQDLWQLKNNDEKYPQAGLIFHERIFQLQEIVFIDQFIALAKLSATWAKENPSEAAELAKTLGSTGLPSGAVVANAVNAGRLPLDFVGAKESKLAVDKYLKLIYEMSPTLIGGKVPGVPFYYDK
ncbi:MAG: hypothetical protein LBU04_04905 [Christensenellaceae bacterium]|jgi:NitT/TauT family transport system substrate-binding protein|nr:hypothetical protein [Christensenellaceae bacterium]